MVGSHLLLHLLENGESVSAIYRRNASIQKTKAIFRLNGKEKLFDQIDWIEADINDVPSLEFAFRNIEYVYHCAAAITFDPALENKLRKVNIEGTANVVNFCLQYKIKKLCFISSIAALGDPKEHETIITEETEWNPEKPHSDYAISKYGAEMEIWRGQQEGLEVVIVNPGVILGNSPDASGWKHGSGEIFTRVANGLPFYTKGTTGFIAVEDVAGIMYRLMKSDISGERFILVSENIPFELVLGNIASALKVKPPFIYAKPWLTSISWRLDWLASFFGRKRKLSQAMARSLHNRNLFSNAKIRAALHYQFTSIPETIKAIAPNFPMRKK